jgi:transketolase
MSLNEAQLKELALTIRILSAEGVEKANSGHPGMPMGAADYAATLWANYLKVNPQDPEWVNRDRFVLSAGHGSMLLYSLLNLFGYDLPMEELKRFRQWESKTPGHPEFGFTPGVDTTTGPLGQGIANAVGMALSGKMLAERYGKENFNYTVYGICGDGDLMEGVASEGASLAGTLGLDNLIFFYDDNEISIGGNTDVCFTESVPKRFDAYGWYVQDINGHDLGEIAKAIENAQKETSRPSLIVCHTTIGFGSPGKAGSYEVHGSPLGKDELQKTKDNLGWKYTESFYIPDGVKTTLAQAVEAKKKAYADWKSAHDAWATKNPELAKQLQAHLNKELPVTLKEELVKALDDGKADATRNISGKAIQVIAKHLPWFVGGSADLEPSTKTLIKDSKDIQKNAFAGKNIRFGVREHGMGAVANGLAYGKCWAPFTATFLVFVDYMRPTLRLAALSHLQTLFIFTHDSFWVGEDGPTHEPIEQILSLRSNICLYVFRPADAVEVGMCYYAALSLKNRPSTLLFTRQNVIPLKRENADHDQILKGAYIVSGSSETNLVLIATGSEVGLAVSTADMLAKDGIKARVVSMPCQELFLEQPQSYRDAIIPPNAKKVSMEAGLTYGWERIVGDGALKIGIDHYGASAPGELLAEKFGFTADSVVQRVKAWLK